jgi:hypothetical protein
MSYPDLIKFPYFVDLTQRGDRGWKEARKEGEERVTLRKTLMSLDFENPKLNISGNF